MRISQPSGNTAASVDMVRPLIVKDLKMVDEFLAKLQFHFALAKLLGAADLLNRYIEEHAPWKLVKESPAKANAVLNESSCGPEPDAN